MKKLIDTLRLPDDLRGLNEAELVQVTRELRRELIDHVLCRGGHLASSLGAAELVVALHHVFETPQDKLIWDTGHQAYIHKMVTGRRAFFRTLRRAGGLSGFLSRKESRYDAFGAGHAATSISAALGMASGLRRRGSDAYVVAVLGDGAMGCGQAFEALNHAGALSLKRFIVVLNDNGMSIAPSVGALAKQSSESLKSLCRALGIVCLGPVDGHSFTELKAALLCARQQAGPVLVRVHTQKGRGFEPAEVDPVKWHAVAPRTSIAAQGACAPPRRPQSYTEIFGDAITELAKLDSRVVAVTAAMPDGTGLAGLARECPASFFDVGICEEHAVTFAAGLAAEGLRPVCAVYSSFMQRGFDQIMHDVCVQNLPVVFALDRAGVVGHDGATHQGVFDLSFLRCLPNMLLMSPGNELELRHMLFSALRHNGPSALRYPRGYGAGVIQEPAFRQMVMGEGELVLEGEDALIVSFGPVLQSALQAAERLYRERRLRVAVINARFAKPLDERLLAAELPRYPVVCTLEDHALAGGFGSAVLEFANDRGIALQSAIRRFGVGDAFVLHASQAEQQALHGYDCRGICGFLAAACRHSCLSKKTLDASGRRHYNEEGSLAFSRR